MAANPEYLDLHPRPAEPEPTARWYCIHCRPRQEGRAETHLRNQGYEVYLPRIRARRRVRGQSRRLVEPMFPRYLFIALTAYRDEWAPIRSTRGVVGLVRVGEKAPNVPESVIRGLRSRHGEDDLIEISRQAEFRPDEKVEITDGAFAGLQALFRSRSSEERVVVLLNLLSQSREVELPADCIRRA